MTALAFQDLAADLVELAAYLPAADEARPLREVAFHRKAWLPEEDDHLRALFTQDAPLEAMVAAIGRPRFGVADRIWRLGLRRSSRQPWSDLDDEELVRRYGQEPAATIAQDLGRACTAVYARAGALGLTQGAAPPYSPWEVAQIRTGYAVGTPIGQIAALIGRPIGGLATYAWKTLGIEHKNHPPDWSQAEGARALELAQTGMPYSAIIAQLADEGFPRRSPRAFGQHVRNLGYGRGWGRSWTAEEEALLAQTYAVGGNLSQLANQLGRRRPGLANKAMALGLQGSHPKPNGARQGSPWSEDDDAVLRANYGKLKPAAIGKILNRPKGAVFNRAWSLGLTAGYFRLFSEGEDLAIRIGEQHGLTASQLGRACGRDPSVFQKRCRYLGVTLAKGKTGPSHRGRDYTLAEILALTPPTQDQAQ